MTKTSLANGQLKAIVDRIERLEEEKKTIAADIKEVYAEAKGNGYDVKALRKIIALRKREAAELAQEDAMVDVYKHALGMIAETDEGNGGVSNETDTSKPVVAADHKELISSTEWLLNSVLMDYEHGLVSAEYADGIVAGCIYINKHFGSETALSIEPWTPLSKVETGEVVQVAA